MLDDALEAGAVESLRYDQYKSWNLKETDRGLNKFLGV